MGLTLDRFKVIRDAVPSGHSILSAARVNDPLANHAHILQNFLGNVGVTITIAEAHASIIAELIAYRKYWTAPECAVAIRYGIHS